MPFPLFTNVVEQKEKGPEYEFAYNLSCMGKSFYRPTRKEMHLSTVAYISRIRVEPVEGKIRRAHLPALEEPVMFGVHSEVAEHYGVSPDVEDPHASTLDYLVAAAGG